MSVWGGAEVVLVDRNRSHRYFYEAILPAEIASFRYVLPETWRSSEVLDADLLIVGVDLRGDPRDHPSRIRQASDVAKVAGQGRAVCAVVDGLEVVAPEFPALGTLPILRSVDVYHSGEVAIYLLGGVLCKARSGNAYLKHHC